MNKKKLLMLLVTTVTSCAFFFIMIYYYNFIAYNYLALMIGFQGMTILSNVPFVLTVLILITLVFAVSVWQLLHLRFNKRFLYFLTNSYLIVLLLVIMLKSRGIRGINYNPLDIINQLYNDPFILFANIALFIPVGMLLFVKLRSFSKTIMIATVAILVVEVTQYLLYLGMADVVDFLTNLSGICLGYAGLKCLVAMGWSAQDTGQYLDIKKS